MKIAYFSKESWEKDFISARLPNEEITFYDDALQDVSDAAFPGIEMIVVFVNSPVDEKALQRFPDLKYIVTRSTGYDHIDLSAAKVRGIVVANVPRYGANTVAEHAFALLLTLSRRTYDAYKQIEQSGSFEQDNLRGFDLAGKTIGIIGCGSIGRHSAKIAQGFGMRILLSDPHEDAALAQEVGGTFVPLETLYAESDVITLHAPHMDATHHMINAESIQKMKRGVYIINTARGALIETAALVAGLQSGVIAGAGLDVLEEEGEMDHEDRLLAQPHPSMEELRTVLANHYLIEHPRVIITPHIAFNTKEALERILETTIENIKSISTSTPLNIIG